MSETLLTYEDIVRRDGDTPPATLATRVSEEIGPTEVPVEVYTSREYHELEKQHIWAKTWQMACREENIPTAGDQHIYDICDKSYLVVRTAADEIKAYVNACLHRGRRLRNLNGNAPAIRCSYHGFTWDLDGQLRYVPCREEFAQADQDWQLPEVAVARWGGYVFINPAPNPTPFEAFIETLPEHFRNWPLEERFVAKHVVKKLRCNWKVAQEAFMEVLHVSATHPQAAWASGDGPLSDNDVFSPTVARTIMPRGVTSPYLKQQLSEDEIRDRMLLRFSRSLDEVMPGAAGNKTARMHYAEIQRTELRPALGDEVDDLTISELCDAIIYTVFPNFHPWGAYYRNNYLFKPYGDDHETCTFELIILAPFSGERPPPSEPEVLDFTESWTTASIGPSGPILDQDTNNIQQVQSGLKATSKKTVRFAAKQESKIRWFYETYRHALGVADRF